MKPGTWPSVAPPNRIGEHAAHRHHGEKPPLHDLEALGAPRIAASWSAA